MKKQCEARNLTMVMDLYELTMANGYFRQGRINEKVVFEVFYRKNPDNGGYAIFAGLEQVLELLDNMHFTEENIKYLRDLNLFQEDFLDYLRNFKFTGNVYSLKEGTIMYPNTPIMVIEAPIIEAQLVETAILTQINHQSLIATKARRVVNAAQNRPVSDFGARRAHNNDAAVYGSRACYIGGVSNTATVMAGEYFGIPIFGTHAHSWIMSFPTEYDAFKAYAEVYPYTCALLIDTYDIFNSGLPNTIKLQKEYFDVLNAQDGGDRKVRSVRIDSGDLAYEAKKIRKILDKNGMEYCKIVASNSLDEITIRSLLNQGAPIDIFGVGERMIVSKSDPVFGAVYKICAVEKDGQYIPKMKLSENAMKTTNPGMKQLWRIFDENGKAISDLLTTWEEDPRKVLNIENPKEYPFIDPEKPWKKHSFKKCFAKKLLHKIVDNGEFIGNFMDRELENIRKYVEYQLKEQIWEEEQRFENPHKHYLNFSPKLWELKQNMIEELRVADQY